MPPWFLAVRVSRYLKGAASPQEVMTWPIRWVNRCLAAETAEGEAAEHRAEKARRGW